MALQMAEARGRASWPSILAERNLAAPSAPYQSCDFQQRRDVRTGVEQNRIAPWRNATQDKTMASGEASKTAEHESEDQGQTASSQPSRAPTAAEPRNTNTDETMMGRAPQSAREKNCYGKGWRDDVAQLGPAGQRTTTTIGPLLAFWSQLAPGPRFP